MKNPRAFPLYIARDQAANEEVNEGMSLRDYFAAAALPQRLTPSWDAGFVERDIKIVAEECYAIADAMLAERQKKL